MGNTLVLTNGSGDGVLNELVDRPINDPVVSATATGPAGNTSEFSKCWPSDTFEFVSQKIGRTSGGERRR